jgi:hypothetical protein
MISKVNQLLHDMGQWPEGMTKVYTVADRIARDLMINGMDSSSAQYEIIQFLKGYDNEMRNGRYTTIINALVQNFE